MSNPDAPRTAAKTRETSRAGAGGPRTAEGKKKSAANAVKHGMTARSHFPDAVARAYPVELNNWRRHLGLDPLDNPCLPIDESTDQTNDNDDTDPEIALAAERVARCAVLLRHARVTDDAAIAERLRTARRDCLEAARDRTQALLDRLDDPAAVTLALDALLDDYAGADAVLARWQCLAQELERNRVWTADQLRAALTLSGNSTAAAHLTRLGAALIRLHDAAGGEPLDPKSKSTPTTRDGFPPNTPPRAIEAANDYFRYAFNLSKHEFQQLMAESDHDRSKSAAALIDLTRDILAQITARRDALRPGFESSLREAEARALISESPGAAYRMRLETALDLSLQRALKRIDLLRKEGRLAPPKPRPTPAPEPPRTQSPQQLESNCGNELAPPPKAPARRERIKSRTRRAAAPHARTAIGRPLDALLTRHNRTEPGPGPGDPPSIRRAPIDPFAFTTQVIPGLLTPDGRLIPYDDLPSPAALTPRPGDHRPGPRQATDSASATPGPAT